jgi:phage shock protein A
MKADAHGVVDAIEDRSLLLRQHLREAEGELDRKKARLEGLRVEEKEIAETLSRETETIAGLEEDIDLAMTGGKEDLARFAIRKLLPLKRRRKAMQQRSKDLHEEIGALEETVEQQEKELENLRIRVKAYLAQSDREGCSLEDPFAAPLVEDEEVELELLRRRQGKLTKKERADV